jgi:5-formyltetrahydrofolate cyclo-ligase
MQNILYDGSTVLSENNFGIMEPVNGIVIPYNDIDMVICPLLTFDKKGYRVGYGKGFYDRFLVQCRADVVKFGLSYFEPIDIIEDIDSHDVKLNYAISPSKLWEFE